MPTTALLQRYAEVFGGRKRVYRYLSGQTAQNRTGVQETSVCAVIQDLTSSAWRHGSFRRFADYSSKWQPGVAATSRSHRVWSVMKEVITLDHTQSWPGTSRQQLLKTGARERFHKNDTITA